MDGEKARRVLFADNPLPTSCVIRNSNFSLWLDDEAREWKNEKRRGRRRRTRKREWMREAHYAFVLLPPKTPLIIGTFLQLTAVKAIVLETWLSTKKALESFLRPSCDLMEPFVFSLKFLFLPVSRLFYFIRFEEKIQNERGMSKNFESLVAIKKLFIY